VISLNINKIPTLFVKAFTSADVQRILDFVRQARAFKASTDNTVLFIDTPITAHTIEAVQKLKTEGFRVCFRDHHGIDGKAANERDRQVELGTIKLEQSLGSDCHITVRRLHPACSTLVQTGEFAQAVAIIADPDADGLTAAMKAAGIFYEEMDNDAALLDGEPYLQVTGSPISQLLAKGMVTLPSFDPQDPTAREQAQQELFANWLEAVQGNKVCEARLQEVVPAYDHAVRVAQELAATGKEVVPGVAVVDCVSHGVFDVGTLSTLLEQNLGCRISVVRKGVGPIAAIHGIQYSLSVGKQYQTEINLQKLLPDQTRSDPQFGIISNVPFLLHVSEEVWFDLVLPRISQLSDGRWSELQ